MLFLPQVHCIFFSSSVEVSTNTPEADSITVNEGGNTGNTSRAQPMLDPRPWGSEQTPQVVHIQNADLCDFAAFCAPRHLVHFVDLKDAYVYISIYTPHRKYLRHAFQGSICKCLVLPFRLSLSPGVFVKCTEAAVALLREKGPCIAIIRESVYTKCEISNFKREL